ncbi:tyrosine-type recombinase/integrase [Halobium palmae]|uniref:Tyrosine-type recombinase/integrase n=1 Tax=Halobium palmae TaxID=1776492 RepID=A0ABD5RUU0_9EURY
MSKVDWDTDADLLSDFESELKAQYKDSTASAYTTGARSFANYLGHDEQCVHPISQCIMSVEDDICDSTAILDTELNREIFREYVKDKKDTDYAPKTIQRYYISLTKLTDFLTVVKKYLESNPLIYLENEDSPLARYNIGEEAKKSALNPDGDVIALKSGAIQKIIDNVPEYQSKIRNSLLLRLIWQTGIRTEEAHNIEWDHLDRGERVLTVIESKKQKKGIQTREVVYHQNLDFLLNVWEEEQTSLTAVDSDPDYLFSTERSEQMSKKAINRIARDAIDAAGYDDISYTDASGNERYLYSAHTIRASYASYMANQVPECSINQLKELLGHENLEHTMSYVTDDRKERLKAARHGPQ